MYFVYGFRDIKSGALSNLFVTAEPFSKVKQNISVSLLQLSIKEPTSPFVLFGQDFDLVQVSSFADDMESHDIDPGSSVNCAELLAASRRAFNAGQGHTSPTEVSDSDLE